MNKLVQYLNQHLLGEVTSDPVQLDEYARDGGPLTYRPQMVARVRSTSDIRKLLRFAWQLAEKGHSLSVTPRGGGVNTTGGAIGSGVVVAMAPHMNHVFEYDPKQRLVRLQPGVSTTALADVLALSNSSIPSLDTTRPGTTVGGWLSEVVTGQSAVKELEVVLANGDLLHTKRISKREFSKKKGEQTFEGDLYRGIDKLLEDHQQTLASISPENKVGYGSLLDVRHKDGSFDLTPLFIGSQGTLGVISEMILAAEQATNDQLVLVAAFDALDKVRDALDEIDKINPSRVQLLNEALLAHVAKSGKAMPLVTKDTKAVLIITLSTGTSRAQSKKAKKLAKILDQYEAAVLRSDLPDTGDVAVYQTATDNVSLANDGEGSYVAIASGAYVPLVRFEEFVAALDELATKRRVRLYLHGSPLSGDWVISAHLNLGTISGKQLVFKLVDECGRLINGLDGSLVGQNSEGRLQAYSAHGSLEEEVAALYDEVKKLFDPHGVLNSGVKQPGDIREFAKHLKSN
jgi:FAD/FMN-containing dehydrogenase